ncbi:MAG: hypothetical protein ABI595_09680 [Actinomycetota bacterium]
MRRFTRLFLSTTMLVGVMWGTQLPLAHAAFDQTPPTLTVNVRPSFVVGDIVTDSPIETVHYASDIEQLIQWSAIDDVGVCSYDLFAVPAGAPPEPILEFTQETQYTFLGSDYNGDFGGGTSIIDGFYVTARDCTGNATTKAVDEHINTYQEDGTSATDFNVQAITYTGTWSQNNCDCFLAGHTATTTRGGARATFTRTFEAGDEVALVMGEGPLRSVISIRLDGKWLMNVDTFAPVTTNRVIVFERTMSAGSHTLAIVNHATPGRQHVDFDAILIGR